MMFTKIHILILLLVNFNCEAQEKHDAFTEDVNIIWKGFSFAGEHSPSIIIEVKSAHHSGVVFINSSMLVDELSIGPERRIVKCLERKIPLQVTEQEYIELEGFLINEDSFCHRVSALEREVFLDQFVHSGRVTSKYTKYQKQIALVCYRAGYFVYLDHEGEVYVGDYGKEVALGCQNLIYKPSWDGDVSGKQGYRKRIAFLLDNYLDDFCNQSKNYILNTLGPPDLFSLTRFEYFLDSPASGSEVVQQSKLIIEFDANGLVLSRPVLQGEIFVLRSGVGK
jgi:hypothetical protein